MPQQTNELKSYMETVIHCAFAMNMHKEFIFHALADELGFPSQKLFFFGKMGKLPRRPQVGPWKFFFHGYSCDAWNVDDQKELIFEFGSEGRIDTHTDFAFFRFITTWPEYRQRSPFFQKERDLLHRNFYAMWDFFREIGLLCLADPQRFELKNGRSPLSREEEGEETKGSGFSVQATATNMVPLDNDPSISSLYRAAEEELYRAVSFRETWSVSSVEEALSFFQEHSGSLPFQHLCSNLSLLP